MSKQMSQLMTWKRDGKCEYGWQSIVGDSTIWNGTYHLAKSSVTDLQPAKAVPLDSIVISKELWEKLDIPIRESVMASDNYTEGQKVERNFWVREILAENPHLIKPEPMKEPTNRFAVVKASTPDNDQRREFLCYKNKKDKFGAFNWFDELTSTWFNFRFLINPVLVSEGVVRK